MKTLLKILKFILISIVSLILIFYATVFLGHKVFFKPEYSEVVTLPTIKNNEYCFGIECQEKISNAEDYISVLADQIKRYNQNSLKFWPENHVNNYYAIVESIETNKAWLIHPNGKTEILSSDRVKEMTKNRPRYSVGFSKFEYQDMKGLYLALSENDLKNVLQFEKYYHLGTYDIFITYAHELFHMIEQEQWKSPDKVINASRNDRFEDVEARAQRNLIFQQVLKAVSENDSIKKELLVKDVVSSYRKYQNSYNEDYKNSIFLDRTEGTAYYFEMISSLYSAYPNQIKSETDLYKGLQLIAKNTNTFDGIGLGIEGYWLSGWTGVLLDQLEKENKNSWKNKIMNDPQLTPLQILLDKYKDQEIPTPLNYNLEDANKIKEWINDDEKQSTMPALFQFLYQIVY